MDYNFPGDIHEYILKDLIEEKDMSLKEVKDELIKIGVDLRYIDLIIDDVMPQIKKQKRKNAFWSIIFGAILIIVSIFLVVVTGGFFFYGIMIMGIFGIIFGIIKFFRYLF